MGTLSADTGDFSRANVGACEARGIKPLLAMKGKSHHKPVFVRFAQAGPAPDTNDPVGKMAHRPSTEAGRRR